MATEYKLSYTGQEINEKLNKIDSLAEKSEVPTKTSQLTNDSGFLTAVPNEYVTETELNAKGYLTQHQSLADYAKTADLGDLATKDTVAKTDLASDVQTSLGKADSALQSYTETDPTVPSWAKATSKPTYTKSEIGLGNVDNVKQYSASNPPPYPVTKVNGKTGAVSLTASDVGADASGTANSAISTHNSNTSAHADIRQEISQLSSEIADEVMAREGAIADVKAQIIQQTPLFADSIEECTDTSKVYVLPDGFIYAYMLTETAGGAGYTNLVPTSTDTDGSIYNGTGYKDGARLSSSGGVSSTPQANSTTTGFIPFKNTDIIRVKGIMTLGAWDNYSCHCYFNLYDSNKAYISGGGAGISAALDTNMSSQLSFTYDETTGVTTLQIINPDGSTGTFRSAAKNASYFRLNGVGKGADLIVTVNEEIKEAGVTTIQKWINTGCAFVPADYEDRIVELERQAEDNAETVEELEQKVNNILDGTSEITASTKFDPTVYGLPVLYLTGDTAPIAVSKDNKVTLDYTYEGRTGTCTLKGQGATSYKMAKAFIDEGKAGKFNYTINFDNAFEAVEGWGTQKKYCLKANWIDHSHSRNVVSAKLWGLIVKSRATANANLSGLVNGGAIDGFPIIIMLNDEFHGLYTFNIPKDGWMFGMEEDITKTQAIVCASDHSTCTQFKSAGMSGFEVEFASDEDNVDWITTSMNRLITACINSDGKDLDTTIANYLDWESAIDYYIFIVLIKGTDMFDKNFILTTFDGTKWHFSAYDIDSTYGLNWDASGLTRAVSNCNFVECAESHRVYELIKKYKTSALKSRYEQLRNNILSETRICQYFENFAWDISTPILLEDVKKYPTIRGSSVNGIDQICRWVRQRLEATDKWIEEL